LALLLAAALAPRALAQGDAAALIGRARQYLDEFNADSAAALLERALAPSSQLTSAQRVRASVLYGVAQLTRGNASAARLAFRSALQLSPTERVDSLAFLEPDNLLREFNTERAAVAPVAAAPGAPTATARLAVQADFPADTTLEVSEGRLPITPRPSRRADAVVAVGPADVPTVVLWSDTLEAGGSGALGWNLRGPEGALVAPGRYALRVTAVDSAGEVSATIERVLVVSRIVADTQPLPAPLLPSAFAPETLLIRRGSPGAVLAGAGLGAFAALLPTALGRTELNKGLSGDGTAYAVAASVTVAGLVGFLGGHRTRYLPENAQRNAELRQSDAASRAAIAAANAQARENAPVRVRLERSGP